VGNIKECSKESLKKSSNEGLNVSTKALIIVDMLNDFVQEGAPLKVPEIESIIGPIKREIRKAHIENYPVIYICDSHDCDDREFKLYPPHAVENTNGSEIIDELKPEIKDLVIKKKTLSSFYNTGLEKALKEKQVEEIILTGCVANICIYFAAFEAVIRGLRVSVVLDAIMGLNRRDYDIAVEQMKKVLKINLI